DTKSALPILPVFPSDNSPMAAAAMFLCGWLALGKKPYQGLLIGVTLAIVVGSPTGEIDTALWRSGDVILGSLLAMLFTGIWPQRAFIHWRIQL
ncbi:FUSC family protein, partial [Pseudomonas aeruginosa]|uniref:FUSC family protein n=1 Tax=Pseudomonas aeruginosa TaxID=287 RepID=UPI0031B766E3